MSISSDTEAGRIVKSAVGEAHENCFLRMYDGIGRKCESRFWLRQETTSTSTFKGARSKSRLRWLILQIGFTSELYGRAAHDKVRVSDAPKNTTQSCTLLYAQVSGRNPETFFISSLLTAGGVAERLATTRTLDDGRALAYKHKQTPPPPRVTPAVGFRGTCTCVERLILWCATAVPDTVCCTEGSCTALHTPSR